MLREMSTLKSSIHSVFQSSFEAVILELGTIYDALSLYLRQNSSLSRERLKGESETFRTSYAFAPHSDTESVNQSSPGGVKSG